MIRAVRYYTQIAMKIERTWVQEQRSKNYCILYVIDEGEFQVTTGMNM
jgi:hypothetical protein